MARLYNSSRKNLQNIASVLQYDSKNKIKKYKHGSVDTSLELFNELLDKVNKYYSKKRKIRKGDIKLLNTFLIALYDDEFASRILSVKKKMSSERTVASNNPKNPNRLDLFDPSEFTDTLWVKYLNQIVEPK